MEKNIFKGAKNGDMFLCRDGGKATFIEIVHSDDFGKDFARLYDETTQKKQCYNLDGSKCTPKELDCDIVSRYHERYTLYMN